MRETDLVITGGSVVDGTGAPARDADVAVSGGRITEVAPRGSVTGRTVLDATGLVITPGFIDLHSHADFSIQDYPPADSSVYQGVTTLLTGNCGFSPFPVADAAALRRSAAFLADTLEVTWTDFAGYAEAVATDPPAINIAAQVGHHALRMATVGSGERPADPGELAAMRDLLARAAAQGVSGFSTGLIYAPGCFAPESEVAALAATAAEHGLLYSTHMRNEAAELIPAVAEAIDAARTSGVRLEISHLKAMGLANHGAVHDALRMVAEARRDGVDVAVDVYPYTASSTTLTSRLPGWAMDGGPARLLDRLADTAERGRIAAQLRDRFGQDVDPEGVIIADLPDGPFTAHIGRSIADIGRELGIDPADAALGVLAAHHAAVSIVNHAMSPGDVDAVLAHPLTSVASDGWTLRPSGPGRPHPRSFGTFARVLGHYVRERGLLALPEAVRKMTSLPASRLGLGDRGRVHTGLTADLAVFDPDTVGDVSTFDDPWRLATGVRHVLVDGVPVLHDGVSTGRRPGRVLHRTER